MSVMEVTRFESHARRINAIIGVQRILLTPMRFVKKFPHFFIRQATVQSRTPANAFLLCASPCCDSPARIRCRGKIENRNLAARIRLRRLESPLLRNDDFCTIRKNIPMNTGDIFTFTCEFLTLPRLGNRFTKTHICSATFRRVLEYFNIQRSIIDSIQHTSRISLICGKKSR